MINVRDKGETVSLLWNPPNRPRVSICVMNSILVRLFRIAKEMFEMLLDARTHSEQLLFGILTWNKISIMVLA